MGRLIAMPLSCCAHLDTTTNHEEHPKGWTPNRRDPVWCPPFRVFLLQQATVAVSRCALSCSVSAALCLGSFLAVDTALAGLPGEPLCEVGLDTQKQAAAAGFKNVLTIGLAGD